MSYRYDRENQIQKYNGVPNKQDASESSVWKKFLKVILPWLAKKWELGNAYLEAKVAKEANEAEKVKAETLLLKIQAEKEIQDIIEIAGAEDEANAEIIAAEPKATEEEIEAEIRELVEKIKLMNLKYGFRISVSVNEKENQNMLAKESDEADRLKDDES